MKTESIMILGGGIMQVPAIRSAKEMGFRVFVADVNPDAPGIRLADHYCEIDLKDKRAIADEAVRLRKEEGLTAVFTAGTDFSATVAYAATAAGLPGLDYTAAMTASNKILMRKAFAGAGVPSPDFYPVKNSEEAFEACERLELPVVIKPVDSMGARGVVKIERIEDREKIIYAVNNAIAVSRSGEALVEEFIDGPEFSLDAIVYDGEVTICGFADRHIFFPPYFIEMGHTMPTAFDEEVVKEVTEVFKRGVTAIGITQGAAKGDMKFSSKKGAMVGEIAARLSGGFMSGWTFPYHSGLNLTAAAIRIASGRAPGRMEPVHSKVSAERAVISIPGTVKSVEGIEDAKAVEFIKDIFINVSPGDSVVFPENNVQKCGNCISAAEDRDCAVSAAENAVRRIFIRLQPGDPATGVFLEREGYKWVPDAYVLTRPADIKALEGFGDGSSGMLPEIELEVAVDWHGLGMKDAVEYIKRLTGCDERSFTRKFWLSFLRGGVQAGVWYIDSMGAVS